MPCSFYILNSDKKVEICGYDFTNYLLSPQEMEKWRQNTKYRFYLLPVVINILRNNPNVKVRGSECVC